jgi:hypothetical protein
MANIYIQNPRWDKTTILRQTPLFSGIFGNHRFSSFPNLVYEWAFVDGAPDTIANSIPRSRRITSIFENPHIWAPEPISFHEVGIVISPFDLGFPPHVKWIKHHPAVPWFYGIPYRKDTGHAHHQSSRSLKCLDYFFNRDIPLKNGKISMIASSKGVTPGHQWRFSVAQELVRYFGSEIDIFGFGHRPVECKDEAIDSYSFSIAIENMASEFYMTEKLCDVALGMSTPIYSGASRVHDYFSHGPRLIPFGCDPSDCCKIVGRIIDDGPDADNVLISRRNEVLYMNNLLAVIASVIRFS